MKQSGKNSRRHTRRRKIPGWLQECSRCTWSMCEAGIDETAAHLMRSARWVRNWLHRYDEGGLDGLRDLPRSGRPRRIPRETIEQIVNKTVQLKCTPAGLQKRIHEETGTKLHITLKIMYVRPVWSSHQQGRQKGRPEPISLQKANPTPDIPVIEAFFIRCPDIPSRAVHGEPHHGVRRHRQRSASSSFGRTIGSTRLLYRVSQGDADILER